MAKSKNTIWVGTMEGIFGYGISVAETTEDKCRKALKKSYREWCKAYPNEDHKTFNDCFEYVVGSISEITLGKGYFDNFKN